MWTISCCPPRKEPNPAYTPNEYIEPGEGEEPLPPPEKTMKADKNKQVTVAELSKLYERHQEFQTIHDKARSLKDCSYSSAGLQKIER